jgi:hypothetical protein
MTCVRQKYCCVLLSLIDQQKMLVKLKSIHDCTYVVTTDQYHIMHNNWDNELGNFMAAVKK